MSQYTRVQLKTDTSIGYLSHGSRSRAEAIQIATDYYKAVKRDAEAFLATNPDDLLVQHENGFWNPKVLKVLEP